MILVKQEAHSKRKAILSSAFTQFNRYGFRKTSMADIAKKARISRASLYSYFENKNEIFRSLSTSIHQQSLEDASVLLEHASSQTALASRMEAALVARFGPLVEIITEYAHECEIYDENNPLCKDIVVDSATQFHKVLTIAIRAGVRTGEVNLKPIGLSAEAAAELIQLCTAGLKERASDLATFRKRLRHFIQIFFAGLR